MSAWKRNLWAVGPVALLLLTAECAGDTPAPGNGRALWSSRFLWTTGWVAATWWLGLVALRIASGPRRGPNFAALALSGFGLLFLAPFSWVNSARAWREMTSAASPSGTQFALLRWGSGDGNAYALARRRSDWGAFAVYEFLAKVSPSGRGGTALVRPTRATDLSIAFSRPWVAAFVGRCSLLAAEDAPPIAPIASWDDDYDVPRREKTPLEGPSPFAFVGPTDDVRDSDVDDLLALWALPNERQLLDALDSRNPHVRDAAARIVRVGGPGRYPAATEKLR